MNIKNNFNVFTNDGSEQLVQEIISKLKFISKIVDGKKTNVKEHTLSTDNMMTKMYRTFWLQGSESRDKTLNFIKITYNKAFELISKYLSAKEQFYRDIGLKIIEALNETKIGLDELQKVYKNDDMFISKVITLADTLHLKLKEIERQYSTNVI